VFEYFMSNQGRLVTREEVLGAVWDRHIVTDDSLTQCVTEIRRTIGDDDRRMLRTIARRGYIFEPSLRQNDAVAVFSNPSAAAGSVAPATANPRPPKTKQAWLSVFTLVALGWPWNGQRNDALTHELFKTTAASTMNEAQGAAADLRRLGRHLFLRRAPGDLAAAERYLERAVVLDPGLAEAWTSLAGVYAAQASDEMNDRMYRVDDRRRALERALELNPESPEAHIRLARFHLAMGQADSARAAFAAAYQYGPDDPTVLSTLSTRAMLAGRTQDAVAFARRAVDSEPLAATHRGRYGRLLLATGAATEACKQLRVALQLSPQLTQLQGDLVRALLLQGQIGEARAAMESLPEGLARDQLHVLLDAESATTASADRLQSDRSWLAPLMRAEIAAHRGEVDDAFELLREALRRWRIAEQQIGSATSIAMEFVTSPLLVHLHTDARWRRLIDSVAPSLA
jgi:DNA-binding winged helix-turn-helix (wHTH) protein/Tfp pilus assembly protein PilF